MSANVLMWKHLKRKKQQKGRKNGLTGHQGPSTYLCASQDTQTERKSWSFTDL